MMTLFFAAVGNCSCSGNCECGNIEFGNLPYTGVACQCNKAFCYNQSMEYDPNAQVCNTCPSTKSGNGRTIILQWN